MFDVKKVVVKNAKLFAVKKWCKKIVVKNTKNFAVKNGVKKLL